MKRSTVHEVLKQFFCAALCVIVLARTCGIHMEFTQGAQSGLCVFLPCADTLEFNCTEYRFLELSN